MCWEAKRSLYQNTMRTAFLISAVGFAEEMTKKAFPNDNFMYSLFSDYIISAYDYCNKKYLIIETDLLISNNSKLKYKMYPIEVKSGKKYSIESLKRFKEKYRARIGECYVIHPRNLSFKVDIVRIPPVMTICL